MDSCCCQRLPDRNGALACNVTGEDDTLYRSSTEGWKRRCDDRKTVWKGLDCRPDFVEGVAAEDGVDFLEDAMMRLDAGLASDPVEAVNGLLHRQVTAFGADRPHLHGCTGGPVVIDQDLCLSSKLSESHGGVAGTGQIVGDDENSWMQLAVARRQHFVLRSDLKTPCGHWLKRRWASGEHSVRIVGNMSTLFSFLHDFGNKGGQGASAETLPAGSCRIDDSDGKSSQLECSGC